MTGFMPLRLLAAVLPLRLLAGPAGQAGGGLARDYPVQPVPFTQVHLHDSFWAPRIETNRAVTIPFAFKQCEETGRVFHFVAAAAALQGRPLRDPEMPAMSFDDTDVYKVIEGASFTLSVHPDPALDTYLDALIAKIAAAQEPDGYLYTVRTMNPGHPHRWAGNERWVNEHLLSHELYCLGHLYEAAVAHYQATGKRTLLAVALRSADLLDRTFGPGKRSIWPGHEIVEMGLVRLYRVTGEERYLRLAKFMLDARGTDGVKGEEYNQSHLPVVQQTEAVGHAVRAGYLYAGMADVAALTGDQAYVNAIDRIWTDVVTRKLYLTGGIGALPTNEAFGAAYELPNLTAYNETCAAIANVYWNHRLFLLHGRAAYIDVMERTLYNGLLSGVSLDGICFFYPNPLESKGDDERQHWFGCSCCPGNLTRFLASISGYQYAVRGERIDVNLFAAGDAAIQLGAAGEVGLVQETNYPWEGDIRLRVRLKAPATFALRIRVPGWAREEPVPGLLYRFADQPAPAATLELNGRPQPITVQDGYVQLERQWLDGDQVRLLLPMPVRRIVADARVEADRGRVALQRGPLVYCLESPDNPGLHVREAVLPPELPLTADFRRDELGGVVVIRGGHLTAIPYYAWANRGKAEMAVWLALPSTGPN